MLHSRVFKTILKAWIQALSLGMLIVLSACMPETTPSGVNTSRSTGNNNSNDSTYGEPAFPQTGIFLQESAVQTTATLNLRKDFNDSFLIRGKALSLYLRKVSNSTKFCMVTKYNYLSGKDKFLFLSAKSKSITDHIAKTTEFYLQVEPNNDVANQNDCLSYNLTNALFTNASNPTASFSLAQVCSECSTTAISSNLKLYFINGEEVPSLSLGAMKIQITGSSSGGNGNSCTDSNACRSQGYDCCLQSQCVKDRALRPSAPTLPGFAAAEEDVRLNPSRYLLYPQFYFVCDQAPPTTTGGSTGGGSTDPHYEAQMRLMELEQLRQCLTPVNGEFSYCTLKIPDASPGLYSLETEGFKDDLNFSTLNDNLKTGDYVNNVVKVIYGGKTLYELGKQPLQEMTFVSGSANDDLDHGQAINVLGPISSSAPNSHLFITYKVDGTCQKLSSSLARCTKTYIQGADDIYSSQWHDLSHKTFQVPSYADFNSAIIVKVGGVTVGEDPATWTPYQNPNRIYFNPSYSIPKNQTVEITYFVRNGVEALTKARSLAQTSVNTMCGCPASKNCNLAPVYNETAVVNYECSYPTEGDATPPVNQTVNVSSKNVPHRYYDEGGVNFDESLSAAGNQELKAFSYLNSNLIRPNNVSEYIGFNEIYGSFQKSSSTSARPAKLVRVKKDTTYDLITYSGSFSTCPTCGNDYYNSYQKIFPQNFQGAAGGYSPDFYESRRQTNASLYRADDLLYGRACFIPATMLPWSHGASSTVQSQRQSRLQTQHFMFANGYSRDWFGFDYGSLIGSFDGVTWFSIGNQRRIKATTGKLYLAVNSYFGDLNVDNNFSVSVSETTSYSSTTFPDHDTETDGAECQKAHFCSNDNDCTKQLGYEYSCQTVASISTNWPTFDANGNEVLGSSVKTLSSIVGGTNGQAKRCVYRGKGSPCLKDLLSAGSSTFNHTSLVGTLACSSNNSCESVSAGKFNDRIARFANSPINQNSNTAAPTPSDLVGLGARILGRPFDFNGKKAVRAEATNGLWANNIQAICIPGRDANFATTTYELNSRTPASYVDTADKFFGVGVTMSSSMDNRYLNSCPATDAGGINIHHYNLSLQDDVLSQFTISQNMSSNLFNFPPLVSQNIYTSNNNQQITEVGYQKNACLRAPGAACFTDMECAPSSLVANKFRNVDLSTLLNPAEERFWEEELVCGNPAFKTLSNGAKNPDFDIKKNLCCREIGKSITVDTQTNTSAHQWCNETTKKPLVAGVNTSISDKKRYSRVHTGFDKMTCDPNAISSTKSFALSVSAPDSITRMKQILGQYKTLDAVNERTCCTANWVRSFASENGGGHKFARTKMQNIDKDMFRNISWLPQNNILGVADAPFECDPNNYANSSCEVKSLSAAEQKKYLEFASSLELLGIPQVAIKTNDEIFQLVNDSQLNNSALKVPLSNSIKDVNDPAVGGGDFTDALTGNDYYSAASYPKFEMTQLKKVFSENEFNCCLPSGQQVTDQTTAAQCCTGYIGNINNVKRCCMPDFTDITVYLNRYVSSEGRGLSESAYDPKTGYIKDPANVQAIAVSKNLCCSGKAMTGVAISKLSIPLLGGNYLPADQLSTSMRFNYRTDGVDNNAETGSIGSIFDAGVKWNNHVYCVPSSF